MAEQAVDCIGKHLVQAGVCRTDEEPLAGLERNALSGVPPPVTARRSSTLLARMGRPLDDVMLR